MTVHNESSAKRVSDFGQFVARATAGLPDAESDAIFNVSGGRVMITQIIGEVTTAIQNQANNLKLQFTPTGGSAIDLCDVVDIANDPIGTMYTMTGEQGYALQKSTGLIRKQKEQVIVNAGAISINCSADNTGSVKWTLYFVVLDDGAYVEAA